MAIDAGVARVVVDNLEEIGRLDALCEQRGIRQPVLLRVAPGVEAHTHAHIKTGVLDTKFGLSLETGAAEAAVRLLRSSGGLELVGLHAHIGSQIFELEPYLATIARVFAFAARLGIELRELSPGGGFGMRYTAPTGAAPPTSLEQSPLPGRERIVATATTLEPGVVWGAARGGLPRRLGKGNHWRPHLRGRRRRDGGQLRPTAYGARAPFLANRMHDTETAEVAIAGKYCESGDVLMKDARLPMRGRRPGGGCLCPITCRWPQRRMRGGGRGRDERCGAVGEAAPNVSRICCSRAVVGANAGRGCGAVEGVGQVSVRGRLICFVWLRPSVGIAVPGLQCRVHDRQPVGLRRVRRHRPRSDCVCRSAGYRR